MYIRQNISKFLLILSLSLVFMISSCSEPPEDKKISNKQTPEASQTAPTSKPESPKVETPKPETPAPETPEPTAPKPAPEPVTPKPEPAKPEAPEPVPPKPVKEPGVADVITMKNPAYTKHKKGIILFTHKKHVEEYEIGCGKCHHDKDGAPLNDLTVKDKVDSCIACHAKPGQAPRPKDKTKLSQKEKLEFHAEAIHLNCITCHKEYNKKNDTKTAPSSCTKCHPKRS